MLPHKLCPRPLGRHRSPLLMLDLVLLVVILFLVWNVYHPSPYVIRGLQAKWPDVLWQFDFGARPPKSLPSFSSSEPTQHLLSPHIPVAKWPPNIAALSIDDAPSAQTNAILDVLADADATATFFVIGSQVPGNEQVLARIVADGHELGNHGMRDEPAKDVPISDLQDQIAQTGRLIAQAYSDAERIVQARIDNSVLDEEAEYHQQNLQRIQRGPPPFYRPGSGFFTDKIRNHLRSIRHRLVLGSVYPHDPHIPYSGVNAAHITSSIYPGAIIICHDRREWTVPMLQQVLPQLHQKGYRVASVGDVMALARRLGVDVGDRYIEE